MTVTGYLFAEGYLAHGEPEEHESVEAAFDYYLNNRSMFPCIEPEDISFIECDEAHVFDVHWLRGEPRSVDRVINTLVGAAFTHLSAYAVYPHGEADHSKSPVTSETLTAKVRDIVGRLDHHDARQFAGLDCEGAEQLALYWIDTVQDGRLAEDWAPDLVDDGVWDSFKADGNSRSYWHVQVCTCGRMALEDS
jgi:hypothetical protein